MAETIYKPQIIEQLRKDGSYLFFGIVIKETPLFMGLTWDTKYVLIDFGDQYTGWQLMVADPWHPTPFKHRDECKACLLATLKEFEDAEKTRKGRRVVSVKVTDV